MERKSPYRAELNGQTCASCFYWRGEDGGDGACRRYPPLATAAGALSPQTSYGFWCGEWRPQQLSTL